MSEKEKEELMAEQEPVEQVSPEESSEAQGTQEQDRHEERHHHHHSHHHHKHSHHRSKHRSTKRFSFRKLKKSFKKHKKIWIPVVAVLVMIVLLSAILGVVELISKNNQGGQELQVQGTEGTVIIAAPVFDEELSLVNSAVNAIMSYEEYSEPAHLKLKDYLNVERRLDVGVPVKLNFYVANKPADYTVEKFTVEIAEDDTFSSAWEYTLDVSARDLELYNLKTGTKYYYRINVHFTNSVVSSACGSFETAASPRVLTIGGIRNARDIGGWTTVDGKTVKQGLLYRGTELEGSVEAKYTLTDEGRQVMLDYLGIKMDMDLRWASQNTLGVDALGEDIKHIYFGVESYTNIFIDDYTEAVRNVFSELAKEENYPIYMHCTHGRDRTGTISCLLEALLGVEEADIWRDYHLSALESKYMDNIAFGSFMLALKNQPGETLQDKTQTYLLSIGVTEVEIASIRAIYLGE